MDELDRLLKRIAESNEVSPLERQRQKNKQRIKNKKVPRHKKVPGRKARERRAAEFRERLKGLDRGRIGEYRNCQHPDHVGDRRTHQDAGFNKDTKYCAVCDAIEKHRLRTVRYLKKVAMARDKLLDAITKGQLGEGTLREFYSIALAEFGGMQGMVQCIRAEYDAADEGSQLRKQYLEMLVRVMVALSTMGQEEQVEQLSDEEIAKRVHEERMKAAKLLESES